ncbi:MAG: DUF4147 domain-containing protein [Planctomycetota bacterium]|nr:DUF4147 domain-containing protein [Planctomycetota bacterium]
MDDPRSVILSLIAAAHAAADPGSAVSRHWPHDLDATTGHVKLLAIGKASVPMARAALARLGPDTRGIVVAPPELAEPFAVDVAPHVRVLAADHPLPTERNIAAAREIEAFARACEPADTLVVLISGGSSAHLTLPAPGLSLDDVRDVTRRLQRAGAPIGELNAVRKHLEVLKGGRLARLCRAGRIECLVLSDVIGDHLSVIGSGPFTPDPTTYADARAALDRWVDGWQHDLPSIASHLESGVAGHIEETPKPGDASTRRVRHTIVAGNTLALDAVVVAARSLGVEVRSVTPNCVGEAIRLGTDVVRDALFATYDIQKRSIATPQLLLWGGEPTVRAEGSGGRGGPSQELALFVASGLFERGFQTSAWTFAYSTDGIDGPTDAAGAIICPGQLAALHPEPIYAADLVRRCLRDHDATTLLERIGAVLRTGPTGTNVNHVWGVLIAAG